VCPQGSATLALVVTDLSADGFVHWVVVGIDPEITGTAEGLAPPGAIQGKNGFGAIGWGGPCPPAGSGEHEYLVQLYALDKDLGLTKALMPSRPSTPSRPRRWRR
jgi:Raf kinase inhibitor-like YbhB/YbcL family protein